MADTENLQAEKQAEGEPKAEAKAAPDTPADLAKLREELAELRGSAKAREDALQRELSELKTSRSSQNGNSAPRQRTREEWEDLFTKEGFTGAMGAYEREVLAPLITNLTATSTKQTATVLEKVAKIGREQVRKDTRCTETRLNKVDLLMSKLGPEERAEPGAWIEALNQITQDEEYAEMKMNGGDVHSTRRTRRTEMDEDLDRTEPDTTELNPKEARWAKKFGMSAKEFRQYQEDSVVEDI